MPVAAHPRPASEAHALPPSPLIKQQKQQKQKQHQVPSPGVVGHAVAPTARPARCTGRLTRPARTVGQRGTVGVGGEKGGGGAAAQREPAGAVRKGGGLCVPLPLPLARAPPAVPAVLPCCSSRVQAAGCSCCLPPLPPPPRPSRPHPTHPCRRAPPHPAPAPASRSCYPWGPTSSGPRSTTSKSSWCRRSASGSADVRARVVARPAPPCLPRRPPPPPALAGPAQHNPRPPQKKDKTHTLPPKPIPRRRDTVQVRHVTSLALRKRCHALRAAAPGVRRRAPSPKRKERKNTHPTHPRFPHAAPCHPSRLVPPSAPNARFPPSSL